MTWMKMHKLQTQMSDKVPVADPSEIINSQRGLQRAHEWDALL